ncbi:MAG: 2-oxoacid:acceptor oxidoreductase family protein [Chloroflexi bacterium]|nr:2-oxoacid:acceptor oxidoreductase family protein [Chloroflexota bacterium]
METSVIFAGVGGRGVLLAGRLLATAAMTKYPNVVWFPAYAGAMRGGPCECAVIVGEEPVGSFLIPKPDAVVIMARSQLKAFEKRVRPGGLFLIDSSVVDLEPERKDIRVIKIPATEAAVRLGSGQAANMVLMGAYVVATEPKLLTLTDMEDQLERQYGGRDEGPGSRHDVTRRRHLAEINMNALKKGAELALASVA